MAWEQEVVESLSRNWGWMLTMGIILVILGTIGLGATFALTLASVFIFGVLLLIGGGAQLFDAFYFTGWKNRLWHILIALIYFTAGGIILYDPVMASAMFTLLIAWALIAIGALRIWVAFQMKGMKGWGWTLVGGIAAILLGIMIMAKWPVSGLWVIGLFVAIELIINGWSMISLAIAARQAKASMA